MIELVLQAPIVDRFLPELLDARREGCVVLYTREARTPSRVRLLVADYVLPATSDYTKRGLLEAQLSPEFVARVTKRAKMDGYGLVFVHSHPGNGRLRFSSTDDDGERHLSEFLRGRIPNRLHAALLFNTDGAIARILGSDESVGVSSIGQYRQVLSGNADSVFEHNSQIFDRQVRAFGAEGQATLGELKVGIVGLGGTGSIVAEFLVHLGVRKFVLIDPDVVETSNLNRLAGARPSDIGTEKTAVAARCIKAVSYNAEVQCFVEDVIRAKTASRLIDADLIFGCTDSHGSRAILQQVAYQYLLPYIDMGTTIVGTPAGLTHIQGRVQLLAPGLACLTCSSLLDAEEVRRDMMTAFERKADSYIPESRQPAPSVMSINGTVASLAVTMFLSVVTGVKSPARHLLYNAISSSLRAVTVGPQPSCFICSKDGVLAQGDEQPLMARQD
jgi:molybdopterin-synthase adenylyltransferase